MALLRSPAPRFLPRIALAVVLILAVGFGLAPLSARQATAPPAPQCVWTGVEKIVAVGDLHGAKDQFERILQDTRLVDADINWTGGKAHLVQMGDVMDRGDKAKEIFDDIRKLEKQAEQAGGHVHMLIGNHEELNLIGLSLQYENFVSQKQFFAFLPFTTRVDWEHRMGGTLSWSDWTDIILHERKVRDDYYKGFREKYGSWIVEHNVVIKIDGTVFVHGGLTESFASMGVQGINDLYHAEILPCLKGKELPSNSQIVFKSDGPLWNRTLAETGKIGESDERHASIDRILAALQADRIVVAHTPTNFHGHEQEMTRYGGKVWVIDTGIGLGGYAWNIRVENGSVSVDKWGRTP